MNIIGGDFFCGAGGFTEGARQAIEDDLGGKLTDWLAINHWPRAIATHSANHPGARHICMRLDQVRPENVTRRGRMDILLASPECTHHSVARGGKPMNDQSRAGAWSIVDWVNRLHIETLLIENVREFRKWGPLNRRGFPIKRFAGQTYQAFLAALRAAGYTVEDRLFNAADYGDPTTRTRLFIQAQRTRPICWPEPSHAGHWIAAREIIDWQLKGESIFTRKRPLSPKTLARIEAGLQRFGLAAFIAKTCNANSGKRNAASWNVHDVKKPLGTVTSANERALIEPFLVRYQGDNKNRDNSKRLSQSVNKPLGTVTAENRYAVAEPFIVEWDHTGGNGKAIRPVGQPLSTLTTKARHGVVSPFLVSLRGTKPDQLKITASGVDKPIPTISAGGIHSALCEPYLVQTAHKGKRRNRSVKEPMPTVAGNRGDVALCEPMIVHAGGPKGKTRSTNEPLRTVMTRQHLALAQPFLIEYYSNGKARSVDDPLSTVTTKQRFGLAMPVVKIGRKKYLVDVLFRMLQPHELSGAQGFPKNYIFTGNKSEVVKQIGNAVPVNMARALVRAALSGKERA